MQLRPGQYSRGPPVTKAQRGEPRLAAREAGTGGCSSEEAEGISAVADRIAERARAARISTRDRGYKTDRQTEKRTA